MKRKATVEFLPTRKKAAVPCGKTVYDASVKLGLPLSADCGGAGWCGKCKIKIIKGARNIDSVEKKLLTESEKKNNIRLACRHIVTKDTIVRIPREKGILPPIILEKAPEKPLLKKGKNFGLAFDVGTTSLAGYLVNLDDGSVLKAVSIANSQRAFGADIISRISFASDSKRLKQLTNAVRKDVKDAIQKLLRGTGVKQENIHAASFAGNTVMHHLFLGIDPSGLGSAPYQPAVKEGVEFYLRDLGIKPAKGAKGYFLPNIGGFVGSDALASILASGIHKQDEPSLIIDIGTNSENIVGNKKKILCGSNAAGPAFEGGSIVFGMRAEPGAVDRYDISKKGVRFHVIGDTSPRGICGSGIIDAIASLLKMGIITKKGNLLRKDAVTKGIPPFIKKRLITEKEGLAFQLTNREESYYKRPVTLFQKDIREIQLAKGAISAGIRLLLKEFGAGISDLSHIYITGAFGNYINPKSGLDIGLFPDTALKKIRFLENGAGTGARLFLLSEKTRKEAETLAKKVRHVEFFGRMDYPDVFIESLDFSKNRF
jgi:uncharacterized 2Fe-2S/4Fe-4S cluster protein (DUF4445 family)